MGSPYGTAVAMTTYMQYTTLFHKKYMCLGLCYNFKAVRHIYQSMPNISNLDGFENMCSPYGTAAAMATYEPPRGKTNNVVSEQVRHKPTCTSREKS